MEYWIRSLLLAQSHCYEAGIWDIEIALIYKVGKWEAIYRKHQLPIFNKKTEPLSSFQYLNATTSNLPAK